MLRRASSIAGALLLVTVSIVGACDSTRRGLEGETCGRTDDCQSPLVCIDGACKDPGGGGGGTIIPGTGGAGGSTATTGGSTTTTTTSATGGSGGSTTSSGGTGTGGSGTGGTILDPVLCHACLDDECGPELTACDDECHALESCIETLCSNLSKIGSVEEGNCQVYCQQLHLGSKSKHLDVVNCSQVAPCQPCSSYPWDHNKCKEAATGGVCADAFAACNANPDCVAFRACVGVCDTFQECLDCDNTPEAAAGAALMYEFEDCIAVECIGESWLP